MYRIALALPLLLAAPLAAADDRIGTLPAGRWDCELPGNAGGPSRHPQQAASFTVTNASRYIAADGAVGSYLLTGDHVRMTSGPLAGTRLLRMRSGFLRQLDANGTPGALRCVRLRGSGG